MNTKLTLTIEQEVIEEAKVFAKTKGRSLSDIIENYLKILITGKKEQVKEFSPVVTSLKGSFKDPGSFDYNKELEKALSEKYM